MCPKKLKSDSMCTCHFYLVRLLNGLLGVPLSWNNMGCAHVGFIMKLFGDCVELEYLFGLDKHHH